MPAGTPRPLTIEELVKEMLTRDWTPQARIVAHVKGLRVVDTSEVLEALSVLTIRQYCQSTTFPRDPERYWRRRDVRAVA